MASNLYTRTFYGGSYFDGLKVKSPNEFDIDLLFTLPAQTKPLITVSNKPGYVHVQLSEIKKFQNHPRAFEFPDLVGKLDGDSYLDVCKFSSWFQSIITEVLNDFPRNEDGEYIINKSGEPLKVKVKNLSGPPQQLIVSRKDSHFDIDLVPCFLFSTGKWKCDRMPNLPQDFFKKKPYFFVVPKQPLNQDHAERYWRQSFQEQERLLIHNKHHLKPALKLLKALRDSFESELIASYYIKTIFLWEVYNETDEKYWQKSSLSYVFMYMLKRFQQLIEKGEIMYFWNKKNNLLDPSQRETLLNVSCRLKKFIRRIEENLNDKHKVKSIMLDEFSKGRN